MRCKDCGLSLESVDDTQIEYHGKHERPEFYCEAHKPIFLLS